MAGLVPATHAVRHGEQAQFSTHSSPIARCCVRNSPNPGRFCSVTAWMAGTSPAMTTRQVPKFCPACHSKQKNSANCGDGRPAPRLGIRGVRSHAISGRGINLLNHLRRHFRATCDGLCREPPGGRDRRGLEPEEDRWMKDRGAERRVPSLVGMTEEVAARWRQSGGTASKEPGARRTPSACVRTNIEQTRNPGKTFFAFFRGGGGTPGGSLILRSDSPRGEPPPSIGI